MKRATALLSSLVLAGALALVQSPTPASASPSSNTVTGRVSVLPGPAEAPFKGDSTAPIVSANGRYVVFTSKARFVEEDFFDFEDVYLRDLLTDKIELISVEPDGEGTSSPSYAGAVSADGRYVVFSSLSNGLVPGDTNGAFDVFIRDRVNKTTERVSVNSAGQQATGHSPVSNGPSDMDVSDDGRYVAFSTKAVEFGVGGNVTANVMVRDRQTGTTESVNVSSAEVPGNRDATRVSMSANGRYVAFRSNSFNITPTDTNGNTGDIFVRDRTLGTTVMASKRNDQTQSFNVSFDPSISDDGTKVAFISRGDLTPGDLTNIDDVFVRNLTNNTTTKISVDFGGGEADQHAIAPRISGDGTTVVWQSLSGEYISGGGNGKVHVFKRVGTNAITRESVTNAGALGNGDSAAPSVSQDGKTVVFDSASTNLVTGDTGFRDTFVRRRPEVGPHTTTSAYLSAMVAHTGGSPGTATTLHNRVLQGASPEGQVLQLLHGTFGAKRAPLVRLYVAYFKRLPDTGGLNYWLNKMNAGMRLDRVSAQFAGSSEFKTKYGNTTNSAFVTLVYQNVLNRNPDTAGLNFWVKKLNGGMSRGTVMTNFSESSEGKRKFRPQVDTALASLALLGKIGPTNLMSVVTDHMRLDSSERGIQRLAVSPEYAAAI